MVRADYVERVYAVACIGNGPDANDALCAGALAGCPDPAATRFWEWTRTISGATGQPMSAFQRTADPAYVCFAPAEAQAAGVPAVDPTVAIAAMVEREFRSLVVLKGVTQVAPSPETLVNFPTRLSTPAPASYQIPATILGQRVVITATARSYAWFLGDGTTTTVEPVVTHTYLQPGDLAPHVVITWSGTFTIGGDPAVRQVQGTATTAGPPTPLGVREARIQYEAG